MKRREKSLPAFLLIGVRIGSAARGGMKRGGVRCHSEDSCLSGLLQLGQEIWADLERDEARGAARGVAAGAEAELHRVAPAGLSFDADAGAAEQQVRLVGDRVLVEIEVEMDIGMVG